MTREAVEYEELSHKSASPWSDLLPANTCTDRKGDRLRKYLETENQYYWQGSKKATLSQQLYIIAGRYISRFPESCRSRKPKVFLTQYSFMMSPAKKLLLSSTTSSRCTYTAKVRDYKICQLRYKFGIQPMIHTSADWLTTSPFLVVLGRDPRIRMPAEYQLRY